MCACLLSERQGIVDPGQGFVGALPLAFELGEEAVVEGQIEISPLIRVGGDHSRKFRNTRFAVAQPSAGPTGVYQSLTAIEGHRMLLGDFEKGFRNTKGVRGITTMHVEHAPEVVDQREGRSVAGFDARRPDFSISSIA